MTMRMPSGSAGSHALSTPAVAIPAIATMEPMDRSNPPVISTNVMEMATMAVSDIARNTEAMLNAVKNTGLMM